MPCKFCKEEEHEIEQCPKVRCRRCGFFGHVDRVCRTKICSCCKRKGHLVDTCYHANPDLMPTCETCGEQGHATERCFTCYRCNGSGHIARNCTAHLEPLD